MTDKLNEAGFVHIFLLLLILVGIAAGVFLVNNRTTFLPKANILSGSEYEATGKFAAIHSDFFYEKKSRDLYLFRPDDNPSLTLIIDSGNKKIPIAGGSRIMINGILKNGKITAKAGYSDFINIIEDAGKKEVSGEIKVGIIKVNINKGELKTNPAKMPPDVLLNSIMGDQGIISKDYFKENSYGKLQFNAEIIGNFDLEETPVFDIPADLKLCRYPNLVTNEVERQIDNNKLSQFTHLMFIIPIANSVNCPIGVGTIFAHLDGKHRTWMLTALNNISLYAHELGHNLGLDHSGMLSCRLNAPRDYDTCLFDQYAEIYSTMGYLSLYEDSAYHYNAPQKSALGWLSQGDSKEVVELDEVVNEKTYKIAPLEFPGSDRLKLIKIRLEKFQNSSWGRVFDEEYPYVLIPYISKQQSEYIYVSYRRPVGFDQKLPSEITNGVSIHTWTNIPYHITTLWNLQPAREIIFPLPPGDPVPPTPTPGNYFYTVSLCDKIADLACNKDKHQFFGSKIVIEQISHNEIYAEVKIYPEKVPLLPAANTY